MFEELFLWRIQPPSKFNCEYYYVGLHLARYYVMIVLFAFSFENSCEMRNFINFKILVEKSLKYLAYKFSNAARWVFKNIKYLKQPQL